ncbi:hypothetical protein HKX48_001433 [Thoreauomyces humboldtii]|nr:hypothetical protein HKX48_001433 [Thoreauomyces humboldtii]
MSFFGFETRLPGGGKGPGRGDTRNHSHTDRHEELGGLESDGELLEGSRLDEIMEKKFAYGNPEEEADDSTGELEGRRIALEDDNEDLNDETFGDATSPQQLGNDFDFSSQGNHRRESNGNQGSYQRPAYVIPEVPVTTNHVNSIRMTNIGNPRTTRSRNTGKHHSQKCFHDDTQNCKENLAEIWNKPASPGQEHMPNLQYAHHQHGPQPGYGRPPVPMSLEEIEASMRRRPREDSRPQGPPVGHMAGLQGHMAGPQGHMAFRPPPGYGPPLQGYGRPETEAEARQRAHAHMMGKVPAPGHPSLHNQPPPPMQSPDLSRDAQFPPPPPQHLNPNSEQGEVLDDSGLNSRGQRPPMMLGHFLPGPQRGQSTQNRLSQGYARLEGNQRFQNDRRGYLDRRPDIRTREERYKGTMNQYEKELIAKIQISQLVTDNPYRDDFYYIVYTSLTAANEQNAEDPAKAAKAGLNWQQSLLMDQTRGNGPNVTGRMQQQMQRLIEGRKSKPKGDSLSLEGALGKISLSSVRNPRQLLQVSGPDSSDSKNLADTPKSAILSPKQLLGRIETVYSEVLELEVLKRAGPDEDEEDLDAWNRNLESHRVKMWKALGVAENVPLNYPHPLAGFLAYGKGKKVIPRVFRFLSRDQSLAVISTLLSRLESLDVCQPTLSTQNIADDVELFMSNVVPTIVSIIMEVPLFVVNACMRIILERHNMVWLAQSKPGLALLTMFLSRAEMIKQGAGGPGFQVADQELGMWTEIYNFLFASLHKHFASLFPSSAAGNVNAALTGDIYVWQFLAALAVGATTVEHQTVLLTEVRDKVLETARRTDDAKSLANVDLFLNALGLGINATQLVDMSTF